MRILLLLLAIAIAVFALLPNLDLTVSRWFYDEARGGFYLLDYPLFVVWYYLIYVIGTVVGGGLTLFFALKIVKSPLQKKLTRIPYYALSFLMISLLAGPGVIVHYVFKENWDRPRPLMIQEFGGNYHFSPPLIPAGQVGKSFISGHASMGFYTVAFAFLFSAKYRRRAYCAGLAFGIMSATARVMQGKHFISDVTFGALITLLVIHLTWKIVQKYRIGKTQIES